MKSRDAVDRLHRFSLISITPSSKEERYIRNLRDAVDEDLDRLEKLEKVIKILKRKVVNLTLLGVTVGDYNNGDTLYCWNNFRNDFIATEQEYELLKEVLGCE